jgi:hypothetical protein
MHQFDLNWENRVLYSARANNHVSRGKKIPQLNVHKGCTLLLEIIAYFTVPM